MKSCVLVTLLALPVVLRADFCATNYTPAAYVAPVYQTYLTLPVYGASYTGNYGGNTDETNRLLAELLNEQKALRAELSAMRTGALPARDPTPILKANCAACHTEGTARSDFTMFDEKGNLFKLSPPDRKAMIRMLDTGQMPPPVRSGAGALLVQKMIQSERANLAAMLKNPLPIGPAPTGPAPAILPPEATIPAPPALPPPPVVPKPPADKK